MSKLDDIIKRLRANDPTLTTLDLSENDIGDEGAKAIATALNDNKTLTSLDLRHNGIGPEGIKAIADLLKDNKTLTTLDLSDNYIRPEGAKAIAAALKDNKTLTTLTLRYNGIGDEGAKAIADLLKDNKTLTTLNLSYNQIGDEGIKAIAAALNDNKTLTTLTLSDNQIGPEGARAIADLLKDNKTLTTLNLSWNQIGPEGAKAIAAALKDNKTLTTLNLSYNHIGDEGAKAIAAALKDNKTLTTLDFSVNQIGRENEEAIHRILDRNRGYKASHDKAQKCLNDAMQYLTEFKFKDVSGKIEEAQSILLKLEAEAYPPADDLRLQLECNLAQFYLKAPGSTLADAWKILSDHQHWNNNTLSAFCNKLLTEQPNPFHAEKERGQFALLMLRKTTASAHRDIDPLIRIALPKLLEIDNPRQQTTKELTASEPGKEEGVDTLIPYSHLLDLAEEAKDNLPAGLRVFLTEATPDTYHPNLANALLEDDNLAAALDDKLGTSNVSTIEEQLLKADPNTNLNALQNELTQQLNDALLPKEKPAPSTARIMR